MNKSKQISVGHRILLVILIIVTCVFLGGCAEKKQQEKKVYRVGILSGFDTLAVINDSFKAGMTELGYTEGKNIDYDIQKTNFEPDKEQQILKKFVDDKVDLIFTFPTEVSLKAKAATQGTGVPVVFSYSSIEGNDLVDSVRQPGGNITGVREPGTDIFVKRLEILHELMPEARRVYINYNPDVPFILPAIDLLRKASTSMNITLVENAATTAEEIKSDLQARAALDDIGIDAILIMAEPTSVSPPALEAMINFATEHEIPIGGLGIYTIRESIIFGYEITIYDMGKLAAVLADKVLKGTPASTIPVLTPEAKLLINYKLAQELGLNVSEGLLNRANEIIR